MKVAALLAATASANPTQFIMDNWWKEAVNVFNFASGNWDQFSSTVDTVSFSEMNDQKRPTIMTDNFRSQAPTGIHSGASAMVTAILKLPVPNWPNVVPRPPHGLVCLTLPRPSFTTSPPNTGTPLTKMALALSTTTNSGKHQPKLTSVLFQNSDTPSPVSPQSMPVSSSLVSTVIAMVSSMLVNVLHGRNSSKVICLNGDGIQLLINKQLWWPHGTMPKVS